MGPACSREGRIRAWGTEMAEPVKIAVPLPGLSKVRRELMVFSDTADFNHVVGGRMQYLPEGVASPGPHLLNGPFTRAEACGMSLEPTWWLGSVRVGFGVSFDLLVWCRQRISRFGAGPPSPPSMWFCVPKRRSKLFHTRAWTPGPSRARGSSLREGYFFEASVCALDCQGCCWANAG